MDNTALPRARRRRTLPAVLALGLAALLVPLWAGAAAAHEGRQVGDYRLAVGFGEEPAYAGQKNSVQVMISDAANRPVTDLGGTLKVTVTMGKQSMDLPLQPFFEVGGLGTPGDYRAFLIPSTPGGYTFQVHGTIKGQKVKQTFSSSRTTFPEVQDPARAAFPRLDQPTTGQVAQRLDRETARLGTSLQRALSASSAADQRSRDAADRMRILTIMGILGFVLGLMSAILGGSARRIARRSWQRTMPVQTEELRATVEV
ncbi:MAG TPA: hypothetical protein VFA45_06310 [Actinomycetes bacterium]|jgi:hypothetical protein|nr:hypothetical protein [Actinomycetes bacterium]